MKKITFLLSMCLMPFIGVAQWTELGNPFEGDTPRYHKGYSMSFSSDGSAVAIGTPLSSSSGYTIEDRSYVQIFRHNEGSWEQLGENIMGGEHFLGSSNTPPRNGHSLALSADGNIVAMGEYGYYYVNPDNESQIISNNRTRIFEYVDDEWQQIGEDIYGTVRTVAISVDGSIVAIGSNYDNTMATQSGVVRVYQNQNNAWEQIGSTLYGTIFREYFGQSIDLSSDGSILAIGAPGGAGGGLSPNPGYVNIYNFESNEWELTGTIVGLYSDDGFGRGSYCGSSLSLSDDGSIISIGSSQYRNENNTQVGNVRVFQNFSGDWQQIGQTLEGSRSTDENTKRMIDLSAEGTVLAIGSRVSASSGNVRVYKNIENEWELVDEAIVSGANENGFGSVARLASGGSVLGIGIPNANVDGNLNAGKAQIYQNCSLSEITVLPSTPDGFCSGNSTTLSASILEELYQANGYINWYTSEDATEPFLTGTEFETPELTQTTSYWVEALTPTGCPSERIEIVVIVNPIPGLTIENTMIESCEGASTTLTVDTTVGEVNWYDSETSTEPIFTGSAFETPVLTETTSYWVEAGTEEGCISERIEIVVEILPAPVLDVETIDVTICSGDEAYLYAYSEGNVIFWYANETDEDYLYHGNNFITEELFETTTYWVEAYNIATGCRSDRVEVTVIVNDYAVLNIETPDVGICEGATATLIVSSDATVSWYDTESGVTPIFTGEEFTTPELFETTSYWVEASGAAECTSDRVEIVVTVNPIPEAPGAEPVQYYEDGLTLADLEVDYTGTVTWYADEGLTIELPDTTPVVVGAIYYVTQTIDGCESLPTAILIEENLSTADNRQDQFMYYPNPVSDVLNFRAGTETIDNIQVYDMSGKLVVSQNAQGQNLTQIDLGPLSNGNYLIMVQTDKKLRTFQIVKK